MTVTTDQPISTDTSEIIDTLDNLSKVAAYFAKTLVGRRVRYTGETNNLIYHGALGTITAINWWGYQNRLVVQFDTLPFLYAPMHGQLDFVP